MKKIMFLFTLIINFIIYSNDISVDLNNFKSSNDILEYINKESSDWYIRDININEPIIFNKKILLNTIFLVPTDDPMATENYELIFFDNGLFIYGTNFWGAQIEVIGNYVIGNDQVKLYNFKNINTSKNLPPLFNLKKEAFLYFKEINYLYCKYGLVDNDSKFTFIMAGIRNNIGDNIIINGISAKKRLETAIIKKTTTGYTKPRYDSKFDITNHNIYDEVRNKVYTSDEDLLFYEGTSITILGQYFSDENKFFFCVLPIMDEYYTEIKLWIPSNMIDFQDTNN